MILQHILQMQRIPSSRDIILMLVVFVAVDVGGGVGGLGAAEILDHVQDVAAVHVFVFGAGGGVALEGLGRS